jgi:hypothetical protein
VVRGVVVACVVLASALLAAGTWAVAGVGLRRVPVVVTPSAGLPATTFVLSFRAPERTGLYGSSQRHDLVVASASAAQGACVATLSVRAPDAHAGARIRVLLIPGRLGNPWCIGRYSGRIEEIQTAVCPHGTACPTYVLLRGIVGRFVFHVSGNGDNTPPTFAGLQEAFACTPGPQQPGQTTPYTLSWQPAGDNNTPRAQIRYDVYVAPHPAPRTSPRQPGRHRREPRATAHQAFRRTAATTSWSAPATAPETATTTPPSSKGSTPATEVGATQ